MSGASGRADGGLVLVPREPTPEMLRAGNEWTHCGGSCGNRGAAGAWSAMLAAAPKPEPAADGGHTPEPWVARGHSYAGWRIEAKQGPLQVFPATAYGSEDAARIVACVNACAGIPTERLEKLAAGELARLVESAS